MLIHPKTGLASDRRGIAAVEFALVAPILCLLLMGTVKFGLTLINYVALTDAVREGARQLAVSRGASTPRTTTVNRLYGAAPSLTQASITITTLVNGTACTSDSGCATALGSAQGQPATVTASYPCDLTIMAVNMAPSCTLSSSTAERVE
jgi:Flp pilus assembly protein TadG